MRDGNDDDGQEDKTSPLDFGKKVVADYRALCEQALRRDGVSVSWRLGLKTKFSSFF